MIQAIQTTYQGYKFRSRLEARWAVFFDALGLKWEYEPEGFQLPGGLQYLPDFRVTSPTGLVQWYEIKPTGGTSLKFDAFKAAVCGDKPDGSCSSDHAQLLAASDPVAWFDSRPERGVCPRCGALHDPLDGNFIRNQTGSPLQYVACWPCDLDTPSGGGHPGELGVLCWVNPSKGSLYMDDASWRHAQEKVYHAALAARAARFEHGESGRPT